MKKLVKLFFSLILIGSIVTTFTASPVFAEEVSEPSITIEETSPENTGNGDEWDGIINDPVNIPVKEPATAEPTPTVITEVTTTVTPPATTNYTNTPKAQVPTTATPTEETSAKEAPTEDATAETSAEPKTTETETIEPIKEAQSDGPVQVPETSTPIFAFDGTTRKITLLALISTAIVYFSCLEIWGLKNLRQIKKNEKLVRTAKEKATKETKINRAS